MEIIATHNSKILDKNNLAIRIISSLAILAIWLKMLSFARGWESTAFLIRMILKVILYMRYFFIVTFWCMLGFATMGTFNYSIYFIMHIINKN